MLADGNTFTLFPDINDLLEDGETSPSKQRPFVILMELKQRLGTLQHEFEPKHGMYKTSSILSDLKSSAQVISTINKAFGFNGWSHEILDIIFDCERAEQDLFTCTAKITVCVNFNDEVSVVTTGTSSVRKMERLLGASLSKQRAVNMAIKLAIIEIALILETDGSSNLKFQ